MHPRCVRAYFETADVLPRVRRFSLGLSDDDLREIGAALEAPSS